MRMLPANSSRRGFLAGVGMAAGGAAFASNASSTSAKEAEPVRAAAINFAASDA